MNQKLRVWVTRPKPDSGVVEVTVEHARMDSGEVRVSSTRLGNTVATRTVLELLAPLLSQNRTPLDSLDSLVEEVLVATRLLRHTSEWKWAESCCELWADRGTWIRRSCYFGGLVCVPGCGTLPLGYVGTTIREAWDKLLRNQAALSAPCATLEPVNTEDSVLRVDGHSAGILLHELVGHPAEEDYPSSRPLIPVEDLDIWDEPVGVAGPNYSTDDRGISGVPVNIGAGHLLTYDTGNAFLGMKHEGGHMLVRQRNLRVRNGAFARVDKASGRNAVVAAAGVSSASGTLAIQCLLRIGDRVRSLRLRIPRGGITSALRNGLPLFYNASVCSKSKCTHIVGIECCGVDFHLARPILTYVENASRKGDQHAVP